MNWDEPERYSLDAMAYCMITFGAITLLAGYEAPYGRYSKLWPNAANVPTRLAWFLQELPSLIIALYYLLTNYAQLKFPNFLIISLFTMHYFHRTLIYPFRIKCNENTPVSLFVLALLFCTCNGYMQAASHVHYVHYDTTGALFKIYPIGIALFLIGMIINVHSDSILINLRAVGESGYKIPRGGMFEYVSGANFLGECTEWIGYAIAAQSLPSLAFAFFTICNIGPRAFHHHRWYLKKFEDYPRNRKALIPLII